MHREVTKFVRSVKRSHPHFFSMGANVLEVGSLDINGSIRKLFHRRANYTGLDLGEGPGVDVICPVHKYELAYHFHTVVSTEMLEHDSHWQDSLISMFRNLKVGGALILTCAGPFRHEHGTKRTTPKDSPFTTDYYRNISIQDFSSVLPARLFNPYHISMIRDGKDLVFFGIKAVDNVSLNREIPSYHQRAYRGGQQQPEFY